MSLFLAILALGLLIIVHESGHFIVARLFKMRVDRFSVGFGPPIISRQRGETKFQLAWIPLGGFVQIAGMNPHDDFDTTDPRVYPNRPAYQRFLAIFAGPATNYLCAIAMIFVVFLAVGVPTGAKRVGAVLPGKPADGKLVKGDVLLEVNGHRIDDNDPLGFRGRVQEAKGAPVRILVLRAGKELEVEITPILESVGKPGEEPVYLVGILQEDERMRPGLLSSAYHSVRFPWVMSQSILDGLYKVVTRQVPGDVTGPVGIVAAIEEHVRHGWLDAFELLAMLNVYLGLFNLLPLPALDGGRLVFLGYELATRRRPNPKVEASVHMIGFVALFLLMILVLFKDIRRLFT